MRTIVAQSKGFHDYVRMCDVLDRSPFKPDIVLSTGEDYSQYMCERWAGENCIEIRRFDTDFKADGPRSEFLRNKRMIHEADALIIFYDKKHKKSTRLITSAFDMGINHVDVIYI